MLIVGIVIAVLVVLMIAAGFFIASLIMAVKPCTLAEGRAWQEQEEHVDLSWYDPLEKMDYTVTSYDGYILHAQFLKNPGDTNRFVIISHGNTGNRFGSMKYAAMYLEKGFNVIVYDLRGHGVNEPTFCTYSIRERKDLLAMILDSRERYPDASLFGIHGESLGAAASIAVLEEKPPVDFVVADCGFSDIVPVLKAKAAEMHAPGFLFDLASVCVRIRFGYSFSRMRPIESLNENTIPILFLHGADDRFIPPEHSERMKEATKGYAEMHLFPGAGHAMSILTDPKSYGEYVANFLAEQFPGR
ncbi:MAG: alpha/beta fold hydrolase [Clostridia bacterium]|nr:alpha/beta fold hydrolase [Clostridia bacterium]